MWFILLFLYNSIIKNLKARIFLLNTQEAFQNIIVPLNREQRNKYGSISLDLLDKFHGLSKILVFN